MDTPNPSADEGGGGAGADSPESSPSMEAPLAVEQSSVPLTGTGLGAARTRRRPRTPPLPTFPIDLDWFLVDSLDRPSAPPEFSKTMKESVAGTSTPPLSIPSSDTSATATALEDSTLRLASGLEFMNLTGGEPPVVEGPSTTTTAGARKRTPGRWRRIPRPKRNTEYLWRPREHSADVKAMVDKWDASTMENIEQIKNMLEKDCDIFTEEDRREFHAFKRKMIPALTRIVNSKPENTFFTYKTFSDTKEEHLTAEGMEAQVLAKFPDRQPCQQAVYFAELAMAHYNLKKKHKFKLATTLLSNCFSESCGTTYGHVNFTGILEEKTAAQPTSNTKRLFFAELMLIPKLQAKAESQPMRVVHVYTIDDDSCYGGCHEMFRKIDHKMRHVMDYERCHACSDRIKHPKGQLFDGGHNSSRMPYYSAM